jgi:hypothetical protein
MGDLSSGGMALLICANAEKLTIDKMIEKKYFIKFIDLQI